MRLFARNPHPISSGTLSLVNVLILMGIIMATANNQYITHSHVKLWTASHAQLEKEAAGVEKVLELERMYAAAMQQMNQIVGLAESQRDQAEEFYRNWHVALDAVAALKAEKKRLSEYIDYLVEEGRKAGLSLQSFEDFSGNS